MNDVENLAISADLLTWIKKKEIKNEKGKLIKVGPNSSHFFMQALYADTSDLIAVRKPSQAGVSTWLVVRGIHRIIYWGINAIHTLPSAGDVTKFVPSKTNEIIKHNPEIKSHLTGKEADSMSQKQFGKGFLWYKGTNSASESLMLTSDENYYDELDKSNFEEIKNYHSRLEGVDSLKHEVWLSTPTVPNFGIDQKFEEGDQKHWRFTCKSCGKRQHMRWPENVDMEKKRYICSSCLYPLKNEWIRPNTKSNPEGTGKWEARFPGRKISSYSLTQMIFGWVKCEDLVDEYNELKKKGQLDYFYNHKLGLPYVAAGSQIQSTLIYRNLTNKDHTEVNSCMGVDVQGVECYLMIGNEQGVYAIGTARHDDIYIETDGKKGKSKWDRLSELMDIYDIRYCVVDGGFTPNEVIAFAEKHPGKVWVNWYKDDPSKAKIIRWADEDFQGEQKEFTENIRVLTERNRMIDWILSDLQTGQIRFFFSQDDEKIKAVVEHTSTTYKRTVTDRLGISKQEWFSTGQDDYFHALIYYRIALERKKMHEL